MGHKEDCEFEYLIDNMSKNMSTISDNYSTVTYLSCESINCYDGYEDFGTINFYFCPICGEKLVEK